MPTYEYTCTECGQPLEAVQSFSDPSLTECPVCGGRLRKVYSAVGIVFKGSGFYRTDSRQKESAGGKGVGASDSGGKESGGKESGGKESGGKESGGKESGAKPSKDAPSSGSSPTTSTPSSTKAPAAS